MLHQLEHSTQATSMRGQQHARAAARRSIPWVSNHTLATKLARMRFTLTQVKPTISNNSTLHSSSPSHDHIMSPEMSTASTRQDGGDKSQWWHLRPNATHEGNNSADVNTFIAKTTSNASSFMPTIYDSMKETVLERDNPYNIWYKTVHATSQSMQ